MTFRLRGGRPKNMAQGLYWIQRHVSDSKARSGGHSAETPTIDQAGRMAKEFNDRWNRIQDNYDKICPRDEGGRVKLSIVAAAEDEVLVMRKARQFAKIHADYIEKRNNINSDIERANMRNIKSLSVVAVKAASLYLELSGIKFEVLGNKILIANKSAYEF